MSSRDRQKRKWILEVRNILVLGGIILLTEVITMAKRTTNLGSYSGPTLNEAISERHFNVTVRNSGASKN